MECANGKIFLPTVAHHNYYALYSLSQLYSPPISRAAKSILHYVRCDLSTFPSNLLVRDLQSRSFIFRQIWWYDPIRRYFVLPFDFLPFFFFFWPRFMKNHVAPIKHLSCQEHVVRVSNTFFFSYVQSAKYKSWPTTRNHDLECINSELASYYTEVTAIGKSIFLRSISK